LTHSLFHVILISVERQRRKMRNITTESKSCPKPLGFYATSSDDPSVLLFPILGNGEKVTLRGAITLLEYASYALALSQSEGYEQRCSLSDCEMVRDFEARIDGLSEEEEVDLFFEELETDEWVCFIRWLIDLIACRMADE